MNTLILINLQKELVVKPKNHTEAKESYIKEVANKWKDQIVHRVYEALMKYEVDIND